ncbi:Carboxylesterase [Roridomyces roridus]|uniref:Carboxylic ester hydrolase n=1 Tax=Roridomyces roridus TaxID=1738132 RepID=A0AAD7BMZ1_9AGAR|nr:Carboxylesterase [Roridomyces roridus]
MLSSIALFASFVLGVASQTSPIVISTTSGQLHGVEQDGVMSFKGVRFGQAPVGQLRWEPPVPFVSAQAQNVTTLGPACLQQFAFATSAFTQSVFNNPPPASENEDCLFLNVWAPSTDTKEKKPVVLWLFGGGLNFGTGSLPGYDGTSLALNQDIVVVTINYRTNVFGFPSSPDLPLAQNNLGFLDQELALDWVQLNIAQFGGDPRQVTIMGQSAGSVSVASAIVRNRVNATFRAGVLLSGVPVSSPVTPSFTSFNGFATAVGCSQSPGPARLECLRRVPALTIRNFTNGPLSGSFGPVTDNVTAFADPFARIRDGSAAKVPILLGNMQDDGSAFTVGMTNLTAFLEGELPGAAVSPDFVRSLYPTAQNDSQVIIDSLTDLMFRCPADLWSAATVNAGFSSVFRYSYGAVFADLQKFPDAGAWHSSEIGPLFGTFIRSTATPAEVTWSTTFQTAIANFIKNPSESPALNWPKYIPGPPAKTYAKLAYNGNVEPGNFVQAVASEDLDNTCDVLWNQFL